VAVDATIQKANFCYMTAVLQIHHRYGFLKMSFTDAINGIPVRLYKNWLVWAFKAWSNPRTRSKPSYTLCWQDGCVTCKIVFNGIVWSLPIKGHEIPLNICMRLISEMDSELNTKGRKNANNLCGCQNTYIKSKFIHRTWKIKLLDDQKQ